MLRSLGAKKLRESEVSQNGSLETRESSPPASEASDEPRSGEQVPLNAAHNTGYELHITQTNTTHDTDNQLHIRQTNNYT